ncbi:MAG: molybdopterin-guanine dinucleotide biosynthesis protein B, partial [Gammaproteobacteria bacterium]
DNIDLVLVEGYKHGEHRKLEVRRAGLDHPALAEESDTIRAVVADERPTNLSIPFLPRDDVAAIADFVLADLGPKQ